MMGIINNMLVRMVEDIKGKKGRKKFLEDTGFSKGFRNSKIYNQSVWQDLIISAVKVTGLNSKEVQIRFAKFVFPIVLKKFKGLFEMASDALSFLGNVPNVHQVWPDKDKKLEDKFKKIKADSNEVIFEYQSPNKLCVFLKALTCEIFKYYNEEPIIREEKCMLKNDNCCRLIIKSKGKIKK